MAKANRASTHKSGAGASNTTGKSATGGSNSSGSAASTNAPKGDTMKMPLEQATTSTPGARPGTNKGKPSGKGNRPVVGGSAVVGAKSTQPRETTSTNPQQQQAESYNRTMRRRMQKMGTGPYNDTANTMQEQRKKRIERKKRRAEELRQQVSKGPRPNLSLGRRNTIFLIAMAAIIVAIIVIAIIVNHPF